MTQEQVLDLIYKIQKARYEGLIKSQAGLNFARDFTRDLKKKL